MRLPSTGVLSLVALFGDGTEGTGAKLGADGGRRKILGEVLGMVKAELTAAQANLAGRCDPGDPDWARMTLEAWAKGALKAFA